MGTNYVKQLGVKSDSKIGTREFNAIWAKYAEKDNTMKKKNAIKFLKDFGTAMNIKTDDNMIDKLLVDVGVEDAQYLTKDAFSNLFFASAENTKHAALTQSVLAYKRPLSRPQINIAPIIYQTKLETSPTPKIEKETSKDVESDQQQLNQLFLCYADSNKEVIDPPGLIKFITDLEINPQDVALLVLGFHMGASIMGIFTKEQFVNGFLKLKLYTIQDIKDALPKLRDQLKSDLQFTEIFKYAHQFYKENQNHKVIPLDVADSVLEMLANDRPHIPRIRKFLRKQKEYKAINQDQWINILDFSRTVGEEDMTDYTENSSWPYLFDLYVEWVQAGHTGDTEDEKEVKKEEKKVDEYDFEI